AHNKDAIAQNAFRQMRPPSSSCVLSSMHHFLCNPSSIPLPAVVQNERRYTRGYPRKLIVNKSNPARQRTNYRRYFVQLTNGYHQKRAQSM
ncbi:hypothetical protein M514_05316, partial [Trichuris suis]